MGLRRKTTETLDGVKRAASTVTETSSWATVALVAVAAVSLLALFVGVAALGRNSDV